MRTREHDLELDLVRRQRGSAALDLQKAPKRVRAIIRDYPEKRSAVYVARSAECRHFKKSVIQNAFAIRRRRVSGRDVPVAVKVLERRRRGLSRQRRRCRRRRRRKASSKTAKALEAKATAAETRRQRRECPKASVPEAGTRAEPWQRHPGAATATGPEATAYGPQRRRASGTGATTAGPAAATARSASSRACEGRAVREAGEPERASKCAAGTTGPETKSSAS